MGEHSAFDQAIPIFNFSARVLGRHDGSMSAFEEALRIDSGFFERWPEWARHYDPIVARDPTGSVLPALRSRVIEW